MTIKALPEKTPKYVEIAARIRRDISAGVLQPGDRLPSFAEMRAELGIGQGTLERVHQLLEKENLIVREANRGVFVAQPQSRRRSGMIGICSSYSKGRNLAYETQLLRGIQNVVAQAGLELVLLNNEFDRGWEKVDGILHFYSPHVVRHLPPDKPNVSLLVPREGFHCVLADDTGGAAAATRYLLELGHRRIALLTTREQNFHARRYAGYESALREAGIQPEPDWLRPIIRFDEKQQYRGSGYETMRDWLQTDWRELGCTALLAQNDATAIGAIQACYEARVAVPEELSVVGFDGAEAADWFLPRLTTVQVPFLEIGEHGAQLLLQLIENPSLPPAEINLPTTLRTGDTATHHAELTALNRRA